jgi:hypothetical protein
MAYIRPMSKSADPKVAPKGPTSLSGAAERMQGY